MKNTNIKFIPLKEQHLPLLLAWLETPHVKAWWDQDVTWTMELIKEKFGTYVHGYKLIADEKKPLHAYIICVDNKEIGYIQMYNAHDFAREDGIDLTELPSSLAAFDIFIGDPTHIGKGYGSLIMQQFLSEFVDPYYASCFVDPDTENIQAVRAYKKAGFKPIMTVSDGKVTWMIRDASKDFNKS